MNFYRQLFIRIFWVFVLLAITIPSIEGSGDDALKRVKRIVGGQEAKPHSQPWIVELKNEAIKPSVHGCDGFIIHKCWIITIATTCTQFFTPPPHRIRITAGDHNEREDGEVTEQINHMKFFVRHPKVKVRKDKFGKGYPIFDAALMRMEKPWKFNENVQPLELEDYDFRKSDKAKIAGWGSVGKDNVSESNLREVSVDIVNQLKCKKIYKEKRGIDILSSMICAGDGKQGACFGDGGSPLLCSSLDPGVKPVCCGIPSFGDCFTWDDLENPQVYTRVTAIREWVMDTLDKYKDDKDNCDYEPPPPPTPSCPPPPPIEPPKPPETPVQPPPYYDKGYGDKDQGSGY